LTYEDLRAILLFSYDAIKIYKKDINTITKEDKIEPYKPFCRK